MNDITKHMIDFIEEKEKDAQLEKQENNSKLKNSIVSSILKELDEEIHNEDSNN